LDLPERCVIKSDETGLHMLLRNLLDNACRYSVASTEGSKRIEIALHNNTLTIRNQCPYLSEEELALVFDRFKRGNSSNSGKAQGSGLGLSICRQLAQCAGFTLALRNRQDGVEGVEVVLELS
jgi:two-component system, OmpR family, sensor histidine kinase BaeS